VKLKEMVALCACLMGTDEKVADENSIRTAEEQNLYDKLVHGINSAYRLICSEVWRPITRERVVLDNESKIKTEFLFRGFLQLVNVCDTNGKTIAAREMKDRILVSGHPGMAVDIYYYYVPMPLIDPADEPVLPSSQVDERAYVYYALSLYFMSQNQYNEARAWELRYRSVADNISQGRGRRYLPMRRWS